MSATAAPAAGSGSATDAVHAATHAATPAAPSSTHPRIRATPDLRLVRTDPDAVQANIVARGSSAFANAHRVKELADRCAKMEFDVAQQRKTRNTLTKKFSGAKTKEEKDALVAQAHALKTDLAAAEAELSSLQEQLDREASKLPNATSPQTPLGPEGSGKVLKEIGSRPKHEVQDHLSFCQRWQLLDLEAGSAVSGPRFYFLLHELALLELALVQWAVAFLVSRGYTPVLPPDLVKSHFVSACGFQPRDEADSGVSQVYRVSPGDLSLAGTAEIPLASMYSNAQLPASLKEKPIKHVAFGHAFRTEAGGQGLAIRGLYRVHQFSKVEIFAICAPESSESLFSEILSLQQDMYSALGLHYRVLEIPSEDLGAPAYRKVDMEAWMPGRANTASAAAGAGAGRGDWGEISSTSNCTDYQARRLNIRCQDDKDKRAPLRFAHTLNGTACAVPRLLISIIEQHQTPDGRVLIPPALLPFCMGMKSIPDKDLFPQREEIKPRSPTEQQQQRIATPKADAAAKSNSSQLKAY